MTTNQSLVTWLVVCGLSGAATYRVAQKARDLTAVQRLMSLWPVATPAAGAVAISQPPPPPPAGSAPAMAPLPGPVVQLPIVGSPVPIAPTDPAPARQQPIFLPASQTAANPAQLPRDVVWTEDPPSRRRDRVPRHAQRADSPGAAQIRADAAAAKDYWEGIQPPGGLRQEIVQSLRRLEMNVKAMSSSEDPAPYVEAAQREIDSLNQYQQRAKE